MTEEKDNEYIIERVLKVIQDTEVNILEKMEKEQIIIRNFLMNMQIRILSIEVRSINMGNVTIKSLAKANLYPDPRHLMCPKCGQFKFKGSESTDEHDTYLMLKCGECQYQYSPSHD